MSYSVEEINGCTRKLSFNFTDIDLTKEIDSALKEKQKTANLKGFRKGKAPLGMIQQMYGPQVENDALYKFISNQFMEAVQSEGIRAVGVPQFENTKYESGKSVSFEATVEIFPEVAVKPIEGYTFEKNAVEVKDEDVQKTIQQYLEGKAEMKEVEGATVENGKFAVINFQGEKPDGERPENMKGEEFLLEIGSNTFIPGFEEGLVGMKAGDKKVLELTFPEDYHMEDLRNAKVKFDTELLEVKEKSYPELSDEMAKEFQFESVEDMKTKLNERLKIQNERMASEDLNKQILDKLIEENSFDVPTALVAQQEKAVKDELAQNLKQQGFDDSMLGEYFDKWKADITEKAVFQVRSGLILDKLATEFGIEVADSDLDVKYEEMSAQSGLPKDQIVSYYGGNEQLKQNLKYAIREEKTFEKITEKSTVKTK